MNYKFINHINLNIGFLKNLSQQKKNSLMLKNKFMLGDTDSLITIN